jgi:hypothetical protein
MKTPTINLKSAKEETLKFACSASSKITMNTVTHFGTLALIGFISSALANDSDD